MWDGHGHDVGLVLHPERIVRDGAARKDIARALLLLLCNVLITFNENLGVTLCSVC